MARQKRGERVEEADCSPYKGQEAEEEAEGAEDEIHAGQTHVIYFL